MCLAMLLKPIWEALALLHNWWIFQIFKGEKFYRTGLCLLYMYKINFMMLQLVIPSFVCPCGQAILSHLSVRDASPVQASAASFSKGAEGICMWQQS